MSTSAAIPSVSKAQEFREQFSRRVLVADGAMGTMLYAKGVFINRCFDELNLSSPGMVKEVHQDYVKAGAEVLETNTFGANRLRLAAFGHVHNLKAINHAGVRIAREAAGDQAYVAGAMGPLGVQGITLCDTTGMAYPTQVQALCQAAIARHPRLEYTAHFHNTRAMGLVNSVAAAEAGIRRFDMSLGGIGGCPYAPGATGNVATEDVVHMLQCMGYDTGMDLEGLIGAAAQLEGLVKHELPSQLPRAGHRLTHHEPPADYADIVSRATKRAAGTPETRA